MILTLWRRPRAQTARRWRGVGRGIGWGWLVWAGLAWGGWSCGGGNSATAIGQQQSSNVVVVYNSRGASNNPLGISDSAAVYLYYSQVYPGVQGLDLADASLNQPNISYTDYAAKIRDPLRRFLASTDRAQQIETITLTQGLPHRILDINQDQVGDLPTPSSSLFDSGNVTYASVDSELTLLWQDLSRGENNGPMDSAADQVIVNPYFNQRQSFSSFDRRGVTNALDFEDYQEAEGAWVPQQNGQKATPGSMYLTARLDGNDLSDVLRLIDRGRAAAYRSSTDAIILDEAPPGALDDFALFEGDEIGHLGDDFQNTASVLRNRYQRLVLNEDETFVVGAGPGYTGTAPTQIISGNVAALASYGGNHDVGTNSPSNQGFVASFAGQLVDGAVMNTVESYNGRPFQGLQPYVDQGDLSTFVAAGGSFAMGNVWEPFAFSLADNEVLLDELTRGELTWAEAAWSSTPWLSWQQMALGDPLAKPVMLSASTGLAVWDRSDVVTGTAPLAVDWNSASGWDRDGRAGVVAQQGDNLILLSRSAESVLRSNNKLVAESLRVVGQVTLETPLLAVRSGTVSVDAGSHLTVEGDVLNGRGLTLTGGGVWELHGKSGEILVESGILTGTGWRTAVSVAPSATLLVNNSLLVREDLESASRSQVILDPSQVGSTSALTVWGDVRLGGQVEIVAGNLADQLPLPGSFLSTRLITAGGTIESFPAQANITLDSGLTSVTVPTDGSFTYLQAGLFASVVPSEHALDLRMLRAESGDSDADLDIDSNDLLILVSGWTGADNPLGLPSGWTSGDFDEDADVDSSDLLSILSNWTGALSALDDVVATKASSRETLLAASWGSGAMLDPAWLAAAGLAPTASVSDRAGLTAVSGTHAVVPEPTFSSAALLIVSWLVTQQRRRRLA